MKNKRRWIAGVTAAVLLFGAGYLAGNDATDSRAVIVRGEAALAADAADAMTSTTGTGDVWCSGEHLFGDINGDGKVNNKDLGALQRYINGWSIDTLVTTTIRPGSTTITTTTSTTTTTTTATTTASTTTTDASSNTTRTYFGPVYG